MYSRRSTLIALLASLGTLRLPYKTGQAVVPSR